MVYRTITVYISLYSLVTRTAAFCCSALIYRAEVQDDGSWVQFDDDKMIPRKDEDVLELAGGGDWHTAYLMLFKPQRVPESSTEAVPLSEATS